MISPNDEAKRIVDLLEYYGRKGKIGITKNFYGKVMPWIKWIVHLLALTSICGFVLLLVFYSTKVIDYNINLSAYYLSLSSILLVLIDMVLGILGNDYFTYHNLYTYYSNIPSVIYGKKLMRILYAHRNKNGILIDSIEIVEIKNKLYLKIIYS